MGMDKIESDMALYPSLITTAMDLMSYSSSSPSSIRPVGIDRSGKGGRREAAFYFLYRQRQEGHIYRRRKIKRIKGGGGGGGSKEWANPITIV